MTLAIFDLDNTLLAGDSDHAWGEFLVERGMVDRVVSRGELRVVLSSILKTLMMGRARLPAA